MAQHQSAPASAAPFLAFLFGILFAAMAAIGLLAVSHNQSVDAGPRFNLALAPPTLQLPDLPVPSPIPNPRS